jgi:trehalose 6-phosphate phosphatase
MAIALTSIQPLREALQRRPFGLLCDVDGTLSPMAPAPSDARVTPRNRQLLEALSHRILVVAVSGRNLPSLRRMVAIPSLTYVGLHGLAWFVDGEEQLVPEAEPYGDLTIQAARELEPLRAIEGVHVEVKTVGIAFHFRAAPNPAAARTAILSAVAQSKSAERFQVHEGILMVELRPPVVSSKGLAVNRLAERFGLRGLLFLGDDVTDIDGFMEARRLRESEGIAAYGIAVTHPEAPPAAAAAADFSVPDVSGVEWLLGEIAEVLGVEVPPVR